MKFVLGVPPSGPFKNIKKSHYFVFQIRLVLVKWGCLQKIQIQNLKIWPSCRLFCATRKNCYPACFFFNTPVVYLPTLLFVLYQITDNYFDCVGTEGLETHSFQGLGKLIYYFLQNSYLKIENKVFIRKFLSIGNFMVFLGIN